MLYKSTRGFGSTVTFEETLFTGWNKDGSLLMPEYIPCLNKETLLAWSDHSYEEICIEIFKLFVGMDFMNLEELKALMKTAYKTFPTDVVPLKKVKENEYILELFHGPTHTFKDLALALAGPILNYAVTKEKRKCFVYVCTSGDTGSAVIEVTKDKSDIDTLVLMPGGDRISDMQRLQMTTVSSKNIHCMSGHCFCDDLDAFYYSFIGVLKEKYPKLVITSLNSLLWLRIMMQTVHLIYGYFQVSKDFQLVDFVIPTGGAGHLTSAVIVQKLGFPISLTPVFNSKNLNTYNFLCGNEIKHGATVSKSLSVAMDIQLPHNLERMIYLWSDYDVDAVKTYMTDFYEKGSCKATPELLKKIQSSMKPFVSTDDDVTSTMKSCYEQYQYIVDPHTAVGFTKHFKRPAHVPTIYLACASPIKFNNALHKASIPVPDSYNNYLEELKKKKEYLVELPDNQKEWEDFCLKYIDNNISFKWRETCLNSGK